MNEAQRSAANVRLKQAEARGAEIRDAKVNVSAAVASGYASATDIQKMQELSGDPAAQSVMAQTIIAKGLRAERVSSMAGTTVAGAPGLSVEPVTVPTFEEWIAGKEQEALQTFSPAKREQMREEYYADLEVIKQQDTLSRLSPLAAEVVRNPKAFFDLTPTKKGELLTELSNAGVDTKLIQEGKRRPLSATQADDLVQAQLTYKGVQELKRKLDALQETGPVIGRARQLNPYDPEVTAIMAEITRIVPGLARGIFKEVGVLTADDVERYTSTLANPRATKEQIEQLHRDTVTKIEQSIQIVSQTYTDLGYDLGTFNSEGVTSGTNESQMTEEQAYQAYLEMIKNQ